MNIGHPLDQLARRFGLGPLRLVSAAPWSSVYAGLHAGDRVAVKLYADRDVCLRESDALRVLHRAGAAVPVVVASDEGGSPPALLLGWIDAVPLGDCMGSGLAPVHRVEVLQDAGRLLGELHRGVEARQLVSATFWRRDGLHTLDGLSWSEHLGRRLARWRRGLTTDPPHEHDEVRRALHRLSDAVAELPQPERVGVLHCDFSLRNIMVDPRTRRAVALLDFGSVSIGDPAYDLAKISWLELDGDAPGWLALIDGWQRATDTRLHAGAFTVYEAVHAVAAMAWADRNPGCCDELRARARGVLLGRALRGA